LVLRKEPPNLEGRRPVSVNKAKRENESPGIARRGQYVQALY